MSEIRKKFTYANLMSSLAVFLVLGGATAVAATHLGRNSVGTAQLKSGAVTAGKIRSHAITGEKIADNSISGNDIAPGSITASDIGAGVLADDKGNEPGEPAPPVQVSEFTVSLRQGEIRDVSPENIAPFSITLRCEETGGTLVVESSDPGALMSDGVNPPEPFDSATLLFAELLPPNKGAEGNLPAPNMKAQDGWFFAKSADGVSITFRDTTLWVDNEFSEHPCTATGVVERPL